MSRLGKTPIPLPDKVEVKVVDGMVHVKGPKGNLVKPIIKGFNIIVEDGKAAIVKEEGVEVPKAMHGLCRALVGSMITGVSKGFEVRLSLIGVGYRAAVQGQKLDLQLGFSHPTQLPIPKGVSITIDKSVLIVIQGCDNHIVGQFAASVRAVKPPEPYKGKGIRYENEHVRKKAGKAAKGKTAG